MSQSTQNGHARLQEILPVQASLQAWSKLAIFQAAVAALLLACLLYMSLVLAPKLSEASKTLECERCREESHAKKIEALRRAQVIEGAVLLQDLREARKLLQK